MQFVYKHENRVILHSVKNLLERNGIECFVKNEHSASVSGTLGITNAATELWVLNSHSTENAISIIDKEITGTASIPAWRCAQCGEENDGSFEVCWKCQSDAVG